ncbi:unnamed protein product [Allacma fusca]|uniref:1-acyl-sn-glycerol-3-phosphate acyltransferase n=1 Tax=Allacma fusca TaxID=39272 RepID=A0A8J2P3Y5_9HEXA|nr:unnamed protein product [Allacma fusca]
MLYYLEPSWTWAGFLTFVTGTIALCYDMSPSFRYHFKFVMYVFTASVIALFVMPVAIFRPKNVRNSAMGAPFMQRISTLLGITWEVQGEEHLAKDFACIVVSNHQSILDVAGMMSVWPIMKKCAAVAKKEIVYIIPFGWIAYLAGTIFIDRAKSKECQALLSESAEAIHEKKIKMWIFPEGTRTKAPTLRKFKKGAFHLALQNKLPIVPVLFSPYTFINDEKKIFNSGKMITKVFPPIDTDKFSPEDVDKLMEITENLMNEEFQKLCAEVQKSQSGSSSSKNRTIFTWSPSAIGSQGN